MINQTKNQSIVKYLVLVFILFAFVNSTSWAAQTPNTSGIQINLGNDDATVSQGGFSSRIIQILGLITILSIAPALVIMLTSFTRIVIILSILRNALGLQQTPPNQVLTGLALFLTFFIMQSTFVRVYDEAIVPLRQNVITEEVAWEKIQEPFHKFMLQNVGEKELNLFKDMAKLDDSIKEVDIPMHALIPAFMISEIKRAFEIGFLLFLPFVIIDIVVASVLMGMGMMMLPPAMITLPIKLIFFVMIDGWYLLCGSIVRSYGL